MSDGTLGTDGARARGTAWWAVPLVALALAAATGWVLLAAAVPIGAGDSLGFSRRADAIVRAADRALASTGVGDGWRLLAWACGAGALVLGVGLVWVAGSERDVAPGAGQRFAADADAIDGREGVAGGGAGGVADGRRAHPGVAEAVVLEPGSATPGMRVGHGADGMSSGVGTAAASTPSVGVADAEPLGVIPKSATVNGAEVGRGGASGFTPEQDGAHGRRSG